MILKFAPGTQSDAAKSSKFAIATPAAAFRDIRWDGDGRSDHLIAEIVLTPHNEACRSDVHV
jgi:hypothetical protein